MACCGGAATAKDGTTYRMREMMFSIGDDYWIEPGADERALKLVRRGDAKVAEVRSRLAPPANRCETGCPGR
ncbi:MAG: hypothetical protein QOF86_3953 [Baekduia sp.]|jgi:uncharacterized protein YxjI|nr:hypothetical protein [Baekduia sp.]